MTGPVLERIMLASGSPRRRELLDQISVAFRVVPAGIDESSKPGENPADYTARIAAAKVQAVAGKRHPGEIVLGADTAVVLGERMLGKPEDEEDAAAMLGLLSGRDHQVYTAVAVLDPLNSLHTALSISTVNFSTLSQEWISAYVDTGEPLDKAGAYGIQGWAGTQIRRVEGSYSSIMGLPLFETAALLSAAGLRLPQIPRSRA